MSAKNTEIYEEIGTEEEKNIIEKTKPFYFIN